MTKTQLITIGVAVVSLLVLYFGCETKPNEIQEVEKLRMLASESTDIQVLLQTAMESLSAAEQSEILVLDQQLDGIQEEAEKAMLYRQLSGKWYDFGRPAVAGYYAQEVATIENTEEAWSIAGTTYTLCVQQSKEEKVREFCTGRAVQAFESAISLNPGNTVHRVNLALLYTENPPRDNPMKGILMLVELNKENPDDLIVLNNLGRLALKTGQYERAAERLERAVELAPDNKNAVCLLARAYEGLGEKAKAKRLEQKCAALSN